jgi:beta-phosphoglucomutase-like phosphatase (HAD superfamily)
MQVFFDFDGPILDCSVKYHNLYKRLLAEQGYEAIALYEYWQKKRDRWKDIEIAALTASNDFLNRYQELRQQLIEDQETLKDDKMWPHVPEMLEQLTSNYEVNLVHPSQSPQHSSAST